MSIRSVLRHVGPTRWGGAQRRPDAADKTCAGGLNVHEAVEFQRQVLFSMGRPNPAPHRMVDEDMPNAPARREFVPLARG